MQNTAVDSLISLFSGRTDRLLKNVIAVD